jgi:hypothetical protein
MGQPIIMANFTGISLMIVTKEVQGFRVEMLMISLL